MLTLKTTAECFYQALVDTVDHDGVEHAGYLAFLAILSLFPFLVFFFATVGFIGHTEIGLTVIDIILKNDIIPPNILPALKPRINEIASGPPQGLLTVAIIGAIWTASSAMEGLRTILNRAYRVGTPPAYIWRRLMSIFEMLALTAIIMLVTFLFIIAPTIWTTIKQFLHLENLHDIINFTEISITPIWHYIRYLFVLFIFLLVVSTAYIILPNTKQSWKSVFPGAAVVVAGWFLSGNLLSTYLSHFPQVNIIYGSLGGVIAALLFFYITSMIFIFGAEFNYNLEKAQGHKIEEKEHVENEESDNST